MGTGNLSLGAHPDRGEYASSVRLESESCRADSQPLPCHGVDVLALAEGLCSLLGEAKTQAVFQKNLVPGTPAERPHKPEQSTQQHL